MVIQYIMCSIYFIHSSRSTCGYYLPARHNKKRKRDEEAVTRATAPFQTESSGGSTSTRRAPYPHTGCLAHADVTYHMGDVGQSFEGVKRVIAYFGHNGACISATMVCPPPVPLHSHVLEVALCQLRNGAGYVQLMLYQSTVCHSTRMRLESANFRR